MRLNSDVRKRSESGKKRWREDNGLSRKQPIGPRPSSSGPILRLSRTGYMPSMARFSQEAKQIDG
jgi:hypothetical protein